MSIGSLPPQQVVSEDDGSFVFTGLSPRSYGLEAHKESAYAGSVGLLQRGLLVCGGLSILEVDRLDQRVILVFLNSEDHIFPV